MKTKIFTLFVVTAGFASASSYLAQTDTDVWSVSRNVSIISGTTLTGAATSTALAGVLSVNQYTGSEQLVRVVISVVQPDPAVSQTIGASITIESGFTDTFTASTSNNRVTETTKVRFDDDLSTALDGGGVTFSDPVYNVTKNSNSYANQSISVGSPVSKSLNVSNASTVLFDSDSESMTTGQLASIFAGVGTVGFNFDTTSEFRWARTGTGVLTASLTGTNSGQVTIEYYAVPEPSAALLGGLGFLCLLRRRR